MLRRLLLCRRQRRASASCSGAQRRQRISLDRSTPSSSRCLDGGTPNTFLRTEAREPAQGLEPREENCIDRGFPSTALRASPLGLATPPASTTVSVVSRACRGAPFDVAQDKSGLARVFPLNGQLACTIATSSGALTTPFMSASLMIWPGASRNTMTAKRRTGQQRAAGK